MPDDYYVSQYSGEEIDARLASAGAGAGRGFSTSRSSVSPTFPTLRISMCSSGIREYRFAMWRGRIS